jgi:hypothetical protein
VAGFDLGRAFRVEQENTRTLRGKARGSYGKRDAAPLKIVNKIHNGHVRCPLIESQLASERTSFAENRAVSLKMIDEHDVAGYGAIL